MKKSDQKVTFLYVVSDIIMLNVSIILSLFMKYGISFISERYYQYFIISNIVWLIVINVFDTYNIRIRTNQTKRFSTHLLLFGLYTLFISFSLVLLKGAHISRFVIFGSIIVFFFARVASHYFIGIYLARLRKQGKNLRRILVLGAGRIGRQINDFCINHPQLGYHIEGFLDDNQVNGELSDRVIGKIYDIDKVLQERRIDEIIIALPLNIEKKITHVINISEKYGKRIRIIPDYYRLLGRSFTVRRLGDLPVINIREVPLDDLINHYIKRLFDIAFSILVLVLLSPIYVLLALFIKLESKGPVLYKPVRVGLDGKHFILYKFRTMRENDDHLNGSKSTVRNDPRITRFGKFIRKHNLDELPQFYNVLIGDMSVVGPRPHRLWLNEILQNDINEYMIRHYLRPGITGWAQVNGWRGPTDTEEKRIQRTNHDIWYMENWTFLLDIRIIFLTIFSKKARENSF